MKKYLFLLLAISFTHNAFPDGRDIFNKNAPGLVFLMTDTGSASGVIISKTGYVLTNWHAIDGANIDESSIGLHWSYELGEIENHLVKFKVIKVNKTKDLALLKIINPPADLRVIKISTIFLLLVLNLMQLDIQMVQYGPIQRAILVNIEMISSGNIEWHSACCRCLPNTNTN